HRAAEAGQAGSAAQESERSELRRLREAVVHEMGQGQVAQPARRQRLQLLERALEVVPSFGSVDDGELRGRQRRSNLAARPRHLCEGGSALAEGLDEIELPLRSLERR